MAASCFSLGDAWRMVPCSGYGSIIRQMKAGRLDGGLLPLDIFAREFLSAHAPVQVWRILTLQAALPRELVISNSARAMLKATQQSSTLPFRIALDGLQSATQRAVEAWMSLHMPHMQARASYKVLPLNTVQQGMEATMIEAFAAPSPWGLMAQHQDLGTLQADFHLPLAHEDPMVLVIQGRHAVAEPGAMQGIQAALAGAHARLCTPAGRALAIELLSAPTPCAFPSDVLQDAFARTPPSALPVPASIAAIAAHLNQLVQAGVWRGNAVSNERLAQSLSVF